jgi:hypothetical protein
MIADHDVHRIAFVTITMGVSAEVREGQTVECGETGELVYFRSTPIVSDSLSSHHLILTCLYAQEAQVLESCMEAGVRCI